MSSHSRVMSKRYFKGATDPRAALEIGHDVSPEPSRSWETAHSNSSVQFGFRKSRKSVAVSDRSTFRGRDIRTRRSRRDSESHRLSKTAARYRRSLQHIAPDLWPCGDHDWLERQPDETVDCFS